MFNKVWMAVDLPFRVWSVVVLMVFGGGLLPWMPWMMMMMSSLARILCVWLVGSVLVSYGATRAIISAAAGAKRISIGTTMVLLYLIVVVGGTLVFFVPMLFANTKLFLPIALTSIVINAVVFTPVVVYSTWLIDRAMAT